MMRFVLPNRSQLEQRAGQIVFQSAVHPELDHFTSLVFEQVCYQYFWRKGLEGELPFVPHKIGGWWKANQEVDLVVLGKDQMMMVECKWSRRPVGTDIFRNLESKTSSILADASQRGIQYALCSRSGFTDNMVELSRNRRGIHLYSWENMI